ncbi:hypothetical protein, partial [Desulfococcus multivorans]|uniref:hypothetical protein n=1 Tax=Desulfococcus multivorans TaxID=897 RepID=UPI001F35FC41
GTLPLRQKDQPGRTARKHLAKTHPNLINIAQHFESFLVEFGRSNRDKVQNAFFLLRCHSIF